MPYTNKRNRNEYMKKYLKKRRREYNKKLLDIKLKIGKCSICGYKEHPEILEFHHKDKKKKIFKFSRGNASHRKFETILKEIKKCILLCPNCHRWMHYNEKKWFREQATNTKRIKE